MTTEVTIVACCAAEKEVHVKITDNGGVVEEAVLQNGGKAKRYVYDGREISVREVEKAQLQPGDDASAGSPTIAAQEVAAAKAKAPDTSEDVGTVS